MDISFSSLQRAKQNLKPEGRFRHPDHRFEWTRQQFQKWAHEICQRYGYEAHFKGIGPFHETHGTPSQMAIFARLA